MDVNENPAERRKRHGITQAQLCAAMGYSGGNAAIAHIETRYPNVTARVLQRYHAAIDAILAERAEKDKK